MDAKQSEALLNHAGLFVIPEALGANDVSALHALVTARVREMEGVLEKQAVPIGIGQGDFSFAEIIHRGRERFDISLHQYGERVACAAGSKDPAYDVLERIAVEGA